MPTEKSQKYAENVPLILKVHRNHNFDCNMNSYHKQFSHLKSSNCYNLRLVSHQIVLVDKLG